MLRVSSEQFQIGRHLYQYIGAAPGNPTRFSRLLASLLYFRAAVAQFGTCLARPLSGDRVAFSRAIKIGFEDDDFQRDIAAKRRAQAPDNIASQCVPWRWVETYDNTSANHSVCCFGSGVPSDPSAPELPCYRDKRPASFPGVVPVATRQPAQHQRGGFEPCRSAGVVEPVLSAGDPGDQQRGCGPPGRSRAEPDDRL